LDQTLFNLICRALCFETWHVGFVLKLFEHFGFEILGTSWFWNFYYKIVLNVSWGLLNLISQFRFFVECRWFIKFMHYCLENYRSWEQLVYTLIFLISFTFFISNSLLPTWAIVNLGIIEFAASFCFLCREHLEWTNLELKSYWSNYAKCWSSTEACTYNRLGSQS
jgi:hypothetical protein